MSEDPLGLFHSTLQSYLTQNDLTEQYQDLFPNHPTECFEKKLNEMGCPIYRGLPRLYHRDTPSRSRLKKEFADWSVIKRMVSEGKLGAEVKPTALPQLSKICFFTWVIRDGWGDYMATLAAIEILKEKFPALEIDWVCLVSSVRGKIPDLSSFCKTHLVVYEKEVPLSLITEPTLQILRSTDLIIQIPTYYPSMNELYETLKNLPHTNPCPQLISIGEYGFLESECFHPKTGNYSMGLHFLEKGIFIRKERPKAVSFQQLENKQLLEWLFPSEMDEESYLKTHHFYLAYLTSPIGGAVYLHALMKAHESSEKTLDICSPDIEWFIRYLQIQHKKERPIVENAEWFLELYTVDKIYEFGTKEAKNKARMFAPGSVSSADFRVLIDLSQPFIGIRGDQSFSEAISTSKPFFYDGRDHARYFLKDLLALAENRIRPHTSSLTIFRKMGEAFLYNLEKEESEWVEETHFQERRDWREIASELGEALRDPKAFTGFKKLSEIICKEHSFNHFFCSLIQKTVGMS